MDLFLALSVHRFVTSVGSYAGFAAIIGLAILILLFFAQARETNALRDHVDELLDRIAGLESRLARQAQAQAAAQETAARAAAAQGAAAPRAARAPALAAVGSARASAGGLPPSPPAGVAAPALSAATRVIPLSIPAAAVGAPAVASGGGGVATAPPPATPAATNGSSRVAPVGVPSGPGSGAPAARPAALGPRQSGPSPARAAATTAGASRRPASRPAAQGRERAPGMGSRGRIALILGLLLAVGVVAVAVVIASSSSSSKKPATASAASRQSTRRAASAGTQINPRTVTVAVLNGTATPGLAHRIAQRLGAQGFQLTNPTTAPDQTRTSTTVAYIAGARPQALVVARALKLGSASVAPVDQGTRAVGCGGTATCTASVFVIAGADLAGH